MWAHMGPSPWGISKHKGQWGLGLTSNNLPLPSYKVREGGGTKQYVKKRFMTYFFFFFGAPKNIFVLLVQYLGVTARIDPAT
jgi:hypothetical protein